MEYFALFLIIGIVAIIVGIVLLVYACESVSSAAEAGGLISLVFGLSIIVVTSVVWAKDEVRECDKKFECSSKEMHEVSEGSRSEYNDSSINAIPVEIDGESYIIVDGKLYEAK